ncbi:hypothetical protein D3C72_1926800 [compost metagenome]
MERMATARWPGLPLPPELKFSDFCRPWLSRSPKLLMPVDGVTPISRPDEAMMITGRRSVVLKGMLG